MDVREKLVEQAISHFWYGVSHDIFSEPVTTYAKLAIEALEKEKESGVMVQSGIDANTFRLMRECERLKEENESISNAVNVLEEINSDLYKKLKGVTVQELDGCECCNAFTENDINGFFLPTTDPDCECAIVTIKFCPMCGRELPQPPKGE